MELAAELERALAEVCAAGPAEVHENGQWLAALDGLQYKVRAQGDAALLHLPVPARPGYIIFKAVTQGSAPGGVVEVVGKEDEANFALIVNGQRPNGAGGIHLSVDVASGIDMRYIGAIVFIHRNDAPLSGRYACHGQAKPVIRT